MHLNVPPCAPNSPTIVHFPCTSHSCITPPRATLKPSLTNPTTRLNKTATAPPPWTLQMLPILHHKSTPPTTLLPSFCCRRRPSPLPLDTAISLATVSIVSTAVPCPTRVPQTLVGFWLVGGALCTPCVCACTHILLIPKMPLAIMRFWVELLPAPPLVRICTPALHNP